MLNYFQYFLPEEVMTLKKKIMDILTNVKKNW